MGSCCVGRSADICPGSSARSPSAWEKSDARSSLRITAWRSTGRASRPGGSFDSLDESVELWQVEVGRRVVAYRAIGKRGITGGVRHARSGCHPDCRPRSVSHRVGRKRYPPNRPSSARRSASDRSGQEGSRREPRRSCTRHPSCWIEPRTARTMAGSENEPGMGAVSPFEGSIHPDGHGHHFLFDTLREAAMPRSTPRSVLLGASAVSSHGSDTVTITWRPCSESSSPT